MTVQTLLTEVSEKVADSRAATARRADVLLREVFHRITTLRQAKRRFADELAPDFHLFDYLRTDELGLSRCLADLLDPTAFDNHGKHGQGGLFLDTLLAHLAPRVEPLKLQTWASADWCHSVVLEHPTNAGRRIDILIRFNNGGMIGIENKPWAGDQINQLRDYAKYLSESETNGQWLLIYLSNRTPDPGSIDENTRKKHEDDGHFLQFGYSEANIWLQQAAEKSRAIKVRFFVEELIKFIRTQVSGETDMNETAEIKKQVLKTRDNLESSFLIAQSLTNVKNELLKKFKDCLEHKLVQEYNFFALDYDLDGMRSGACWTGFCIRFSKDQIKETGLSFAFYNQGLNGFYWGINLPENEYLAENREEIHNLMKDKFGDGNRSKANPWYQSIDKQPTLAAYKDWGANLEPWLAIYDCESNDSLVSGIVDLAVEVQGVFESKMDLLKP